ncbi:hypothetical protein Pcinc_016351 [Petrolisthes cinctipes]|uniref:Arf-GAP domain-containing protein n=1 Tax=Petrolisthes cinctipes TaxID=88211 RepID=A0AAE1KPL9_PETCI|nr:hypothetical protein Pcinc_016351 [Petrolisthes cinctipes]
MASSRRKQDEKNLKTLRELGSQPANRTCFDCHQRGTTYINMTVGSFVCTSCSGILRGLNPPHRVKSISMATFTQEEIDQIKSKGNQYCGAVWLGLYDAKLSPFPDTKDENKIREFMITKYEKKRFYVDPSIALKNMPPQTPSGTSSTASTPNSDTPKPGPPAPSASVSRPSVPPSQSSGSVSGGLAGSKSSTPKSSISLDLLSDLASPPVDPFASPTPQSAASAIPSFANFENANIFTNTSGDQPSQNQNPQDDLFSLTPPPSPAPPSSSSSPSRSPSRSPSPSPTRMSSSSGSDWECKEVNAGTPLIPIADSFPTPALVGDAAASRATNKSKSSNPPVVFASGVSAQFICPPPTNTGVGLGRENAQEAQSPSRTTKDRHSSSNTVLLNTDTEPTSSDALLGGLREEEQARPRSGSLALQGEMHPSHISPFGIQKKSVHSSITQRSFSYSSLDIDVAKFTGLSLGRSEESPETNVKNSKSGDKGPKGIAAFLSHSKKRTGSPYRNLNSELRMAGKDLKKSCLKGDVLVDDCLTAGKDEKVSQSLESVAKDNTNQFATIESASLSSSPSHHLHGLSAACSVAPLQPIPQRKREASKPIPIIRQLLDPSRSTTSSSCPIACPSRASPVTNPFVSFLQPATNPHQDPMWGGRTGGSLGGYGGSDELLHVCLEQQQQQVKRDTSMTPADYLLTGTTTASNKQTPSGPHLPFSSNPLTPMTPNSSHTPSSTSVTPATTNATPATHQQPKQDRYAALKDLDEEFKTQKESETISNGGVSWPIPNGSQQHGGSTTGVFGAPGAMNGTPGAFGSPSNGVFGAMNGAGGANGGVMGTPPTTNNAWANFTRANPFSGCNNGGNAWMNGGTNIAGGSTQHHQGFGSVVQHNPFGASPDPNFNQFGGGNTVAALNGSSPAAGGGNGGGGWASFPQNNKMQWMATNGAANGTVNPFMQTPPQMPSSGSSYNPFL